MLDNRKAPSQTALGAKIRDARQRARLTVAAAAGRLSVSVHVLYAWERGDRRPVEPTYLEICQIYGVEP